MSFGHDAGREIRNELNLCYVQEFDSLEGVVLLGECNETNYFIRGLG